MEVDADDDDGSGDDDEAGKNGMAVSDFTFTPCKEILYDTEMNL